MFLKSHHWVDEPYTAYEIRRSMRVRECRQTAICWDRKYFDIDTGKFDSDRMHTLYAQSWNDLVLPCPRIAYGDDYSYGEKILPDNDSKWFTPPDDDFDIECAEDIVEVTMQSDAFAQIALQTVSIAPTFIREDNSPMICTVKKNCWIPKS